MLRSMTGIGIAAFEDGARRIVVEARSVNHRHLKLTLRCPPAIALLEGEIETRLRAKHSRGAIHVSIEVRAADASAPPRLDAAALKTRCAEIAEISNEITGLALSAAECFQHALRLPGAVAETPREAALDDGLREAVLKTAERAFESLAENRAAEGSKTATWLRTHVADISRFRGEIVARAPEIVRSLRDRLVERVTTLMAEVRPGTVPAEEAILREAAHLAERTDVAEELNRLGGHIEHFEEVLREGKDAGRRLDFLAQELLREANTIGSKASDLSVARSVVGLKVEIEKFKEQVQNLE